MRRSSRDRERKRNKLVLKSKQDSKLNRRKSRRERELLKNKKLRSKDWSRRLQQLNKLELLRSRREKEHA